MQHDIALKELNFDLLTPRVGGLGLESKIFTTELLHLWFSFLIWYATWPCSEKVEFDLLTQSPGGWGRGSAAKIFVTVLLHFVIPFIWYATMTMFWKRLNFDLLIPSPGSWEGGCSQNIRDHVDAFLTPINLICNMTMKKLSNPSI